MSHHTIGHKGMQALGKSNWEDAEKLLSQALQGTMSPKWLIGRSRAYVGLKRFQEALEDAELAWHYASERNDRNSMSDAQYRRAVALNRLGRYADAICCATWSHRLIQGMLFSDPKLRLPAIDENGNSTALSQDAPADLNEKLKEGSSNPITFRSCIQLRHQVENVLRSQPDDHPSRKVAVEFIPERKEIKKSEAAKQSPVTKDSPAKVIPEQQPQIKQVRLNEAKIDFYQTTTTVTATIFAKGIDPKAFSLLFYNHGVCIQAHNYSAVVNIGHSSQLMHF
jgi:suppressor of G2 allele of SKP1